LASAGEKRYLCVPHRVRQTNIQRLAGHRPRTVHGVDGRQYEPLAGMSNVVGSGIVGFLLQIILMIALGWYYFKLPEVVVGV
jgi:hypothetical protein